MPHSPAQQVTVTFLFTDIQGSTHLWEQDAEAMREALDRHNALVRQAIEAHDGRVFKTVGDAFCAAFATAPAALAAALAIQRAMQAQDWGTTPIKVRVGLHTGSADAHQGDYFGPALNRVNRLMSAGHGGQILLSLATQELVRDRLPENITLRDMGERRLRDLIRPERIFQVVAPDLPENFAPLRTLDYRPNNLPAQTTSFVGREAELAQVRQLLRQPAVRLLTLTGPGGMGKTRLALQAAADVLDDFEHGVFLVSLAPLSAPDMVIPAIAQALNITALGSQPIHERLKAYLQEKQLLLLLDNFEHMTDAAAAVLDLLAAAPRLKVLVTSRALLRVSGEHDYAVPPLLELPDPRQLPPVERLTQYAAVQLFIERAQAVKADFAVTNDNAPAVAEICYRLDGLPLAIELAAAWAELLTPGEILAELDRGLDFLETDLRDVPERHRSIRAVFDYSWNLLTEPEQRVFRQMAVFRGGLTRQAAQAVVAATLPALRNLVNKSLLRLSPDGRYDLHELARQYAAEKLEQLPDLAESARDRHCAYYCALLQQWAESYQDRRQQAAVQEMRLDGENARAAWEWALARGQLTRLDQAMDGLIYLHDVNGLYHAAEAACRTVVEKLEGIQSSEAMRLLARALLWQSRVGRKLSHKELAGHALQQSQALVSLLAGVDARAERARWLLETGERHVESNRPQARQFFEQSLALYRELGNRFEIANVLYDLGDCDWLDGNYGRARQLFEQSLAIRQELEVPRQALVSLQALCYTDMYQGRLAEAERLGREWLALARDLKARPGEGNALVALGETYIWQGDFAQACDLLEQSLAVWQDLGLYNVIPTDQVFLNMARTHLGLYNQQACQATLAMVRQLSVEYFVGYGLLVLGCNALAEGALDDACRAWREGVELLGQANQRNGLGQLLAVLALAVHQSGQAALARQYVVQALQIAIETGALQPRLYALPVGALLLADAGQAARGVEMYALALDCYPFVARSRWIEDVIGRRIAAAAAGLPPEAAEAARERGRNKDAESAIVELTAELGASSA